MTNQPTTANGSLYQGQPISEQVNRYELRSLAVRSVFAQVISAEMLDAMNFMSGTAAYDTFINKNEGVIGPPAEKAIYLRKWKSLAEELMLTSRDPKALDASAQLINACDSQVVVDALRSPEHQQYPFNLGHLEFFDKLRRGLSPHHEQFLAFATIIRLVIQEQFTLAGIVVRNRHGLGGEHLRNERTGAFRKRILQAQEDLALSLRWVVILDALEPMPIESFFDAYLETLARGLKAMAEELLSSSNEDSDALASAKSALLEVVFPGLVKELEVIIDGARIDHYLNSYSA